jgi:tRNA 2-selenouridine synthase
MFVIGGLTGAGKTALLRALRSRGESVVDLEGLARHRGSVFGSKAERQPTHRSFVRAVRAALEDAGPYAWVEDEGPFIGSVGLPRSLYAQFATAPVVWLEVPQEVRIARLLTEYGQRPDLEPAVLQLAPRFGQPRTRRVLDALRSGDLESAATTLLEFYDSAYRHRVAEWSRPLLAAIDGTKLDDAADAAIMHKRNRLAQAQV